MRGRNVVEQKFAGKTVLITGGSRGQGAAEARMFAAAGAAVVIGDVQDGEGTDLARAIAKDGGRCEYHRLDVSSEQNWRDIVAFTLAKFGSLHVLVNNAGVSSVSYTHLRAHETDSYLVCRLLLEK